MADKMRHIFTSESVSEGHPDKMADQISDAVLDAVMKDDPTGRVACEVLVTTGICVVAGEITTTTYVDVPRLADLFRELRAAWNIPIIIATENAEVARELRPLGAFAYIHKPFDWEDLRRRVAMVIYSALRSGEPRAV